MTCSVEGCGRKAKSRGYCQTHYKRLLAGKPLDAHIAEPQKGKACSVDGCGKECLSRGMCVTHYNRMNKRGSTDKPTKKRVTKCRVPGCDRPYLASGLCKPHYERKRSGNTDEASLVHQAPERTIVNGYVWIHYPTHPNRNSNGRVAEHRLMGSNYIGRPLLESESVHHRNGQRDENTIGPCFMSSKCACTGDVRHNLEFWSRAQPAGQRISDKLQWAHELIATYEQDEIDSECHAFADGIQPPVTGRPANDVTAQAAPSAAQAA